MGLQDRIVWDRRPARSDSTRGFHELVQHLVERSGDGRVSVAGEDVGPRSGDVPGEPSPVLDTTELVELAVADGHGHVDVPHVESPRARRRHRVVHPSVDAGGTAADRIRHGFREPGRPRERVSIRGRGVRRLREIAGGQGGELRSSFLVLRPERLRRSGRQGSEFLSVVLREPLVPLGSHLFGGRVPREDDAGADPLGEQRGTGERTGTAAGPTGDEERRCAEVVGQGRRILRFLGDRATLAPGRAPVPRAGVRSRGDPPSVGDGRDVGEQRGRARRADVEDRAIPRDRPDPFGRTPTSGRPRAAATPCPRRAPRSGPTSSVRARTPGSAGPSWSGTSRSRATSRRRDPTTGPSRRRRPRVPCSRVWSRRPATRHAGAPSGCGTRRDASERRRATQRPRRHRRARRA